MKQKNSGGRESSIIDCKFCVMSQFFALQFRLKPSFLESAKASIFSAARRSLPVLEHAIICTIKWQEISYSRSEIRLHLPTAVPLDPLIRSHLGDVHAQNAFNPGSRYLPRNSLRSSRHTHSRSVLHHRFVGGQ